MKTSSTRTTIMRLTGGLSVLFVMVSAGILKANDHRSDVEGQRSAFYLPSAPIAGELVSPRQQAQAFGGPLPVITSVTAPAVCAQESTLLIGVASWISIPDKNGASQQIAVNYSNGVWMAVSPASFFAESIRKLDELPTVEEFFKDPEDPVTLRTGSVRGHTAWIKDLSATFDCEAVTAVDLGAGASDALAVPEPTSSPAPTIEPMGPAVMYAPSQTADISWKERGFIIEVAGPYSADFLQNAAESMVWGRIPG